MKNLFLWKSNSVKELTIKLKSTGGRNSFGKISTYHRGKGHSKRYRLVDFKRNFFNLKCLAIIRRFDYDPNRRSYLALICYENNFLSYILANEGMYIGQILSLQSNLIYKPGYVQFIKMFNLGVIISNIENKKNFGGIFSRAAGTKSFILKKYINNVLIKLPSKQLKLITNSCSATLGSISNNEQKFVKLQKAGQNIWRGFKPHVRGVAMNPVDHPHGGGEGKTSGGRCSVSPWGILTKGFPTVRGKKRKLKFKLKL